MITIESTTFCAEVFRTAFYGAFPEAANEIKEKGCVNVTSQQWKAIQQLVGFADGPCGSRLALRPCCLVRIDKLIDKLERERDVLNERIEDAWVERVRLERTIL